MAYPIWITGAGNLGIVPALDYYQFRLDAYDTTAGTLKFIKLSGTLPPGIQIIDTGILQGIPISTAGPDLNQTYTFTVRALNTSSGGLADRTFSLTITNVAPPVIVPRNENLGRYFDGTEVYKQLEAVEFIQEDNLIWSLKSGELPTGLSISSSGLLSGYLNEIPAIGPSGDPGWDDTDWDLAYTIANAAGRLGWDFTLGTISKTFTFTIEVTDGVLSDISTYTMLVVPKMGIKADATIITVDTSIVDGVKLSVDTGSKHEPIILTNTVDIPPERQGSWFTYKIDAVDLDDDILQYDIPTLSQGSYDEQTPLIPPAPRYVDVVANNANIRIGANSSPYSNFPAFAPGAVLQILAPTPDLSTLVWYNANVTNYTTIRLAGNTRVSGNIGNYISQSVNSANATIANISPTFGTLTLGGAIVVGTISVGGALITANIGDFVTQIGSTANATVTFNTTQGTTVDVRFTSGVFALNSGNLKINGANIASYPVATARSLQYVNFSANVGDVITQPSTSASATVTVPHSAFDTNTVNPFDFQIKINSGNFTTGSGNLQLNGTDVNSYPQNIACTTDVTAIYSGGSGVFKFNITDTTGQANIAGVSTGSYVSSVVEIGVDIAPAPNTQGTGFDSTRFDQGTLAVPSGLDINLDSGWITGYLPSGIPNRADYEFLISVYKRDDPSYITTKLLSLSILGDLYNEVNWLTPSYLGTIENGSVSDISITAISTLSKSIFYTLTPSVISSYITYTRGIPGPYQNLPQGLTLQPNGQISGRVSFELFGLDRGTTIFDTDPATSTPTTSFDHTFEFNVMAETFDQTASATRIFSILVLERTTAPYENLYLKALLNRYQRLELRAILQDQSIFPPESIYRSNDPWFGITNDIKTLYLPGLNPSLTEKYIQAMQTNHFTKRLLFGDIKTAVAKQDGVYDVIENNSGLTVGTYNVYTEVFVPTDFSLGFLVQSGIPSGCTVGDQHVKYEVIYVDIYDENSNNLGQGPADIINLAGVIKNPYYNNQGIAFDIATPNAFTNMDDAVLNSIGYLNKGALPDWMTSIQPNGVQLGFTRAVVLAYVEPGTSDTIAWRLQQRGYNLNELNFSVDRYLLDNNYTTNYNIASNSFITSTETTFDRYPPLVATFTKIGSVDYAVDLAFENINERSRTSINSLGGLDGVTTYTNGETIVFYTQEYPTGFNINDSYNQGWTDSLSPWDGFGGSKWDDDAGTPGNTSPATNDDLGWDSSTYVPGYQEWLSSRDTNNIVDLYSTPNQRISIWRVNIDSDDYVTLTLANVEATVTSYSANTAGFGSNIRLKDTQGIFVGMPVRGTGLTGNCQITDISGNLVTIYPPAISSVGTTLTFIPQPSYNDAVYVRNGFTHGGVNMYYDPYIKENKIVPNYSEIPQQIKTTATVFDGNGTLFYDYRDKYSVPEQGAKYLKFPHVNVFDN